MKLSAFRIKNFRSIIDTNWQVLAFDNITSLIGQNESGKTSVLEGLRAFFDSHLIEDMLRSDMTLPRVSCRFDFNMSELENIIDLFIGSFPGIIFPLVFHVAGADPFRKFP